MSWADAILARAVGDGLLAQKKLDGDTTIIASDNHEELQRIISQGRRAEGTLRQIGKLDYLKMAYRRGGVTYVE